MKKLLVSLLCAGAVSASASAFAIPSGVVFQAFIPDGSVDIPVGAWDFEFAFETSRACVYDVEWFDPAHTPPIATEFFVEESKTKGSPICLASAFKSIHSALRLAPNQGTIFGFDRANNLRPVTLLTLGEDGEDGEMNGIIEYGPAGLASSVVESFELEK
jgi:hypothetical protein